MLSLGSEARCFVSIATLLLAFALGTTAALASSRPFNIDAQEAPRSLLEFGRQSAVQILFASEKVKGIITNAVHGSYEPVDALRLLLKGTPLVVSEKPDGVLVVEPASVHGDSSQHSASSDADAGRKEGKKSLSDELRVAQVGQGNNSSANSVVSKNSNSQTSTNEISSGLSEIIVTAQKSAERIQDVPVPVSVINAESLVTQNQVLLRDWYTSVPGLNVAPSAQSSQVISIRGITTGYGSNPTVGITIDDMPYTASVSTSGGNVIPDFDPADLARVEVLRGPQGTLYGASSMGGLIKFVTADPNTDRVSGRISAGLSTVENGAEAGYNVRGSVNVPLSDSLAVRASGFSRIDPGYVDNPIRGIDGINKSSAAGGLLSALWAPSGDFSLKVSALAQRVDGNGSSDVQVATPGFPTTTGLTGLQQNYLPGVGGYDRRVQAYGATMKAKLGSVDFTSVTGYSYNQFSDSIDFSFAIPPASTLVENNWSEKFTQEFRFSGSFGQTVDWLAGAYYTHESSDLVENISFVDAATGAPTTNLELLAGPTTFKEYAAFADLTFHVTDRFNVQVGGRESEIRENGQEFVGVVGNLQENPSTPSKANAFTYLVTPSYKLAPEVMVYARLASGYRAGGPNFNPGGDIPQQYNPDKTRNYEIGFKGDLIDHSLFLDASVYYIDWSDIQLNLDSKTRGMSYTGNGGNAKSEGVELSAESKPLTGLSISAWVAWNEAQLTQNSPLLAVHAVAGDRLPFNTRVSGTLSVNQDFRVTYTWTGLIGASASYVGSRLGEFTGTTLRESLPSYVRTDVHVGARNELWLFNVYANNIADRRGVLSGGLGFFPPSAFQYIQPRTIGLSLARSF